MDVGEQRSQGQILLQQEGRNVMLHPQMQVEINRYIHEDWIPVIAASYCETFGSTQEYRTKNFWAEFLRKFFERNKMLTISTEWPTPNDNLRRVDIIVREVNMITNKFGIKFVAECKAEGGSVTEVERDRS
ncbi:hypothetical protein F5X96DRAFT_664420 [Biscogniauxia mediterranea]|nr:hypothetical protein F5X96DRAFT_664420 [Biscogniauxia mediterranea]